MNPSGNEGLTQDFPMEPQKGGPQERMLRLRDVMHATGLSRSTIYRSVGAGNMPRPVQITARCIAWPESKIRAWINERIAQS